VLQWIRKYFFLIPDPRIRNPELKIRIWEAYFLKRICVAVLRKYFFLIPDPRIRKPELQIRIWEASKIFLAIEKQIYLSLVRYGSK